jgi:trehalose 6-phosphate synthase/phosphatase
MVGLRTNFTHLDEFVLESAFTSASRKVMIFDYDGTLVKTKDTSSRLANEGPGSELKAKLKTLSEDAGTIVFIVSGRSRSQLQQWFHDVPELGLAAEKGCFLRWPAKIMAVARESVDDALQRRPRSQSLISKMSDQDSQRFSECEDLWDTLVPVADFSWKKVAMEIIESYTTHTDGSWIEDKELAIVWHYDSADRDYGRMQAAELAKYLDEVIDDPLVEIDISDQNYVLEIKPCNISKGSTVSYILERTRMLPVDAIPSDAKAPLPFVLCVGDDRSDEEMFMALDESVARLSQNATDSKAKISGSIKHQKKNVSRRRVGQVKGKEFKSNSERAQICKPSASTFTCCVGIKPSNARFYVYDEADLLEVITTLAELSVSKQTESQNIAIANKKTN